MRARGAELAFLASCTACGQLAPGEEGAGALPHLVFGGRRLLACGRWPGIEAGSGWDVSCALLGDDWTVVEGAQWLREGTHRYILNHLCWLP